MLHNRPNTQAGALQIRYVGQVQPVNKRGSRAILDGRSAELPCYVGMYVS